MIGAYYQRSTNDIYQDYLVDGLAPHLSVNGWPGTIWLTLQERKDQDWALFGEAEFDVTPQVAPANACCHRRGGTRVAVVRDADGRCS